MRKESEERLVALKRNQEEFGHEIREVKEQLAKLMKMFEDMGKGKRKLSQDSSSSSDKPKPSGPEHTILAGSCTCQCHKGCNPDEIVDKIVKMIKPESLILRIETSDPK